MRLWMADSLQQIASIDAIPLEAVADAFFLSLLRLPMRGIACR